MKTLNPTTCIELARAAESCFRTANIVFDGVLTDEIADNGLIDLVGKLANDLQKVGNLLHTTLATLILWAQRLPEDAAAHPKRPEPATSEGGDTPPYAR